MKDQILEKLLEYLQSTQDFVLKESPEVIQQALRYHYLSNVILLISCCVAIVLLSCVFYYFYTHPNLDKHESRDMLSTIGCAMSPFFIIMLTASFLHYSDNLIKISYAPKYFLIQLFMNKAK
jgi:hypothetical protein